MKILRGKGINDKVACGVLVCLNQEQGGRRAVRVAGDDGLTATVEKIDFCMEKMDFCKVENSAGEVQRFRGVLAEAAGEYDSLYQQCVECLSEKEAEVFRGQALILTDAAFANVVVDKIVTNSVNAEYAVYQVGCALAEKLEKAGDVYIAERAQDVRQVRDKVLKLLTAEREQGGAQKEGNEGESDSRNGSGIGSGSMELPQMPFVVAVNELTPEELLQLPKAHLQGLILQKGNIQSHTAILARAFGLATVMQLETEIVPEWDGMQVIVDGNKGMVYLEPNEDVIAEMGEKQRAMTREHERLQGLKGYENITRDGRKIDIYANVSSMEDVKAAFDNDAGGIGLLRSEFLYLGRETAPDEEEQFAFYKEILELSRGKEVIVRTFDFGADKVPFYLHLEREDNPALGLRGIRLGFQFPKLLKVQLRALYRASAYGNLSIMYPMISELSQVDKLREMEQQIKRELSAEGRVYRQNVPVGIMIETPSAALLSKELAQKVDFFSVGTNDLTQYTYARDRQHSCKTGEETDREAVLRLIELSTKNAHEAGIRIGICGEMAADLRFTKRFLDMGIDELSVVPGEILRLRQEIRNI